MAAMVTATSNGGEKDWRDECVKPPKDDRIQTQVPITILKYFVPIQSAILSLTLRSQIISRLTGRLSNKGPRVRELLFEEGIVNGNI